MSHRTQAPALGSHHCGRLKHTEVKWLWVQEKVSEKALWLRKHFTETNIADLATKYLARLRMEVLLAAGNLVLVSGERERNGQCILEDSAHIIVMLFLGLGIIFMSVLSYAHDKQEGYQSGCIDGECPAEQGARDRREQEGRQ